MNQFVFSPKELQLLIDALRFFAENQSFGSNNTDHEEVYRIHDLLRESMRIISESTK